MRFERLRIHGFKSFVDPTELGIAPGLTGVVGPNGCGKSNLLEALRWVMGEGSARSLRGAGMDDVIFAGTATRPARGTAEVQLHLIRDGEDVDVVRRIERGTGSAYRIKGRDARARDVALLFADASTGAHSPALVGQGRIGAIIAAKPAERRQMLEEAAGIAGLHVRRREAETRLRATEANLETIGMALIEAEARAGALVRQARAAERYRAVSARVRVAEARLLFARWRDASEAERRAGAEAADASGRVADLSGRSKAAEDAVRDAHQSLASTRAAAEAARAARAEAAHRLATLAAERASAVRRLADLAASLDALAGDRDREGALAVDAAAAIARLIEDAHAAGERAAALEAGLPTADAARVAADDAARDAEIALARAQAALAGAEADARVAVAAKAAAAARLGRAETEHEAVARDRVALADPDRIMTARDLAAAQMSDAERGAAAAGEAAVAAEADRAETVARRDEAEAASGAARAALAALDAELAALTRAMGTGGGDRLIDAVRAAPGAERALAAALGDMLDAPLGAFPGAEARADDPPLPADAVPLATLVTAPPALARRLAQVAVTDADDGAPLAGGQRLVTRDGKVRRWDGYRGDGDGAVAAEQLRRRNRLDAIAAERTGAAAAVTLAEDALAAARRALDEADDALAAGRAARATAEEAGRSASRALAAAEAELDRLTARREAVDVRAAATTVEIEAATADRDRADAIIAALPDIAGFAAQAADLRRAAETARALAVRLTLEAETARRDAAAARAGVETATRETRSWRTRAGEAARRVAELDARAAAAAAERQALTSSPDALDARIAEAEAATNAVDVAAAQDVEAAADARRREQEAARDALAAAIADAREARAAAGARAEAATARRIETGRIAGERFECPAPVLPERLGFDEGEIGDPATESSAHERLVAERERIGPVNLVAEQELTELRDAIAAQAAERDELAQAVAGLRGSIASLNREGRQRLVAAFEAVDGHFRRLFGTLFQGGEAHLTLIDAEDPLDAGLEIMAQPPGKRLQSLGLLSGGEQALTAVALIFALFLTAPAPVCVLDEVDAPLDDANIERFCDLLDRMAAETETRYLVVTHNAVTMARMHRLYGVTMVEQGVSRLVSVDLGGATSLMAAE